MSENVVCDCEENYKDETNHFQIHLIGELSDINKQLGQANILQIESHYLMKDLGNQITMIGSLIALSISVVGWTLIAIHKRL